LIGIVSAAWGVCSVGSSADRSGPNAHSHATTYGRATINTGAIRASVMNANAADANAADASAPATIREGII
jgi:hypothetical protein